jgi:hypothetical protein
MRMRDVGDTSMRQWALWSLSLLFVITALPVEAQTFEQDEWRFVPIERIPATGDPLNFTDFLVRSPNDDEAMAQLVDNLYPTNLTSLEAGCVMDESWGEMGRRAGANAFGPLNSLINGIKHNPQASPEGFELSRALVDESLQMFAQAAQWLGPAGFRPIPTYARMPEYRRLVNPATDEVSYERTGRTVNLLGCTAGVRFLVTLNTVTPNAAFPIRIGPMASDLRDRNSLTFKLTATHEFMHVYQNNFSEGFRAGKGGNSAMWVSEALPDAIALSYLRDQVGGHSAIMRNPSVRRLNPYVATLEERFSYRFYMARPYFLPLNMSAESITGRDPTTAYSGFDFSQAPLFRNAIYDQIGYGTNGFWLHVAERYLGNRISRVSGLYDRLTVPAMSNVTATVDAFLDANDGPLAGLEHVFPQFLAEYEGWWDDKVDYNGLTEELWNRIGFAGCEELKLDEVTTSATLEIELAVYSGRCIDVVLSQPLAELSPELQFAAYGPYGADIADQLYLAISRIRNAETLGEAPLPAPNTSTGDVTCFDQVEQGILRRGQTCLLDPKQGTIEFTGSGRKLEARTFNISEIGSTQAGDLRIRLILTSAPEQMFDVDTDLLASNVGFAVSADVAAIEESNSGAASPAGGSGAGGAAAGAAITAALPAALQASAGGGFGNPPRARVNFGLRQSRGPMNITSGGVAPSMATFSDIFTGNIAIPGLDDPTLGLPVKQAAARFINVVEESGPNEGRSVGFFLDQDLVPGATGPVDVMGVYSHLDGEVSIQDPESPSELTITRHNDEALGFRGRVNVCVAALNQLMAAAMRDEEPDLCRVGRRLGFDLAGAVAFPEIVTGSGSYTAVKTPALEAYQGLRLAQLQARGMVSGGPSSSPGGNGNSPSPPGVALPGQPPGDAGGVGCAAPIYSDAEGCDCACASKACFAERQADNRLIPAERSCRLICNSQWAACDSGG